MDTSKAKKSLSLFLAVIMLLTMMPTTVFTLASDDSYPVMMQFTAASGGDFHRYYKQVYSITFLDEIDEVAMEEALEKWDISANTGSGEVMSWMYLNEEATAEAGENRYDVYIAGDGGVGANPQSGYIFYMFEGLKKINNPENFKTVTANTFKFLFYGCFNLEEVDFSSWDVSNVVSLERMFYRCYGLRYANLSGWDTSNVTNMFGLFEMTPPTGVSPDYSLERVDLSGWDTSSVTTMENMFKNCEALTELDLSSFDTSKVTTMRFMFYYCKSLKNIYVGNGWTTEAIANINDGVFNCCYALIGGTDDAQTNQDIYNDKHPSAYYPPSVEYAKTKEEGGYLTDASQKPEPENKEYKVTYEFIGDIIPEGVTAPTEAVYKEGTMVDVADKSSADGYVFSGWSTEDATVTDNSFTINNDVHFVGSWSKLYKVTYKYDEGYEVPAGAPDLDGYTSEHEAGEWVDVFGVPYVDRYLFVGWTTDDADIAGDMFVMPENDVVLYGYFKIPVESIEIMNEDLVINEDETTRLNVYVKPEDATIKDIIYESSNDEVVTVDKYGNITAVGEGTAVITIKSADDETKSDTITVTVKKPVTEMTVEKKDFILNKGSEDKITATVNETATNKKIIYESKDESIVTVDEDGNIKAVSEGTATVIVYPEDNPSLKEEITVTVKVPVTEITVAEKEITLEVDEIKNVEAKVNKDATNKELIYESSDPGVAKVDSNGDIIAVGEGTATITITSKDNKDITDTVTVTVVKKYKVTYEFIGDLIPNGVTAPETEEHKNGSTVTVKGNPEAEGYTFSGWSTDDITVSDGKFVIDKDVHFVGSFVKDVTDITVDKTEIELEEGETDKITVTVIPDDATNKEVTYKSSDEDVVKVDENGNITAVGEGTATITITSKDDPTKKETIKVTVKAPEKPEEPEEPESIPVEDVIVDKSDITLNVGETDKITATVTPDNATNKEVTYISGDETIVKVDENGNITAVGKGKTSVIIVSKDDPSKAETVFVTVKVPVEDITADKDDIKLEVGETEKITVTVTPDNASDKDVTYESSDESVVKIDENGNITAVGEGEATITITSKNDPTKKDTVKITVTKSEEPSEPEEPTVPDYTIEVPDGLSIFKGETKPIGIVITPDDGSIVPTYKSSDESVVRVDAEGNITGVGVGAAIITVDFGNGDVRLIPVAVLTVPTKHHVCFGKTDGIGWYEVAVNGGDFFPQGPNSTLEVYEGSVLIVRVQDMWIDDEFDFYVNGKKVPLDPGNTITVVVDGYTLIGALSMDVPVPDAEESLNLFQKILKAITDFFAMIKSWFTKK